MTALPPHEAGAPGADPGAGPSLAAPAGDQEGPVAAPAADAFGELRRLLLGDEPQQLAALARRVATLKPEVEAADVGRVLPAAIALCDPDGNGLAPALLPAVERAIGDSVGKNPRVLTDAIFPILGPVIRRAVATALARWIEQTRYAVEHAFSLRGWRWRLEAWATGRSFQEVVLFHTLIYRVEQVFLIHRETGLLLKHVVAESAEGEASGVQDADLVSGMLTAIQDFVRDSFRVREGESLDSVQVGELTVWLERGPHAVVAGVIRGHAPQEVRALLHSALENCHRDLGEQLRNFSGDGEALAGAQAHLLSCLQAQYQPPARRDYLWITMVVLLLGSALLVGGSLWRERQREQRWQATVEALRRLPGVVVLAASRQHGRYAVQALRDPDAEDLRAVVAAHGIDPQRVDFQLSSYLALDQPFVLRRARALLRPPATVTLQLADGVLTASGSAETQWLSETRLLARAIPGISGFRDQVRELLPAPDLHALLAHKRRDLEALHLAFLPLSDKFRPNQEAELDKLIAIISSIYDLAPKTNQKIVLHVIGVADQSPQLEAINHIGAHRAEAVARVLQEHHIDVSAILFSGIGAVDGEQARLGSKPERPENWAVRFRVEVGDPVGTP